MKYRISASVVFLAVLLAAGSQSFGLFKKKSKDFVPEDYQTEQAIAKGAKKLLQQSGLKRIRKGEPKTVAITQFSVEYITSQKQLSGAGRSIASGKFGLGHLAAKGLEISGVGEKQYDLDEELRKGLPNHLYSSLVESLKSEGFNVLTLEQVTGSEAYQSFKTNEGADEGNTRKSRRARMGGRSSITKVSRYSAEGLATLKGGLVSGIKNMRAEAKLMHDLGADISMRVVVRLGVYNRGRPSIEPETIFQVVSGYSEAKMPSGTVLYNPKNNGTVRVKKQLLYGLDVVDAKDFEMWKGKVYNVDSGKFTEAMDAMFPVFSRMVVSTFH